SGHNDPILRSGVDAPVQKQQPLSRELLQFPPELVSAAEQRHVSRILEVGQTNDPVDAMRRAQVMTDVELLQSQNAPSPGGTLENRGAAHASHANHNHVVIHEAQRSREVVGYRLLVFRRRQLADLLRFKQSQPTTNNQGPNFNAKLTSMTPLRA